MSYDNDDDRVRLACGGDAAAFAALVTDHYDRIYRLAHRWTGRREAAEDVAQDVCVKLGVAIRSFRGDCAFSTWLYRLVHAAAIDHLRRGRRLVLVEPLTLQSIVEAPDSMTPDTALEAEDLWAAVRALPLQQRDAVTLVYGADLSHAEAADILECSAATVSWHLHEARKRLRIELEAVA